MYLRTSSYRHQIHMEYCVVFGKYLDFFRLFLWVLRILYFEIISELVSGIIKIHDMQRNVNKKKKRAEWF